MQARLPLADCCLGCQPIREGFTSSPMDATPVKLKPAEKIYWKRPTLFCCRLIELHLHPHPHYSHPLSQSQYFFSLCRMQMVYFAGWRGLRQIKRMQRSIGILQQISSTKEPPSPNWMICAGGGRSSVWAGAGVPTCCTARHHQQGRRPPPGTSAGQPSPAAALRNACFRYRYQCKSGVTVLCRL